MFSVDDQELCTKVLHEMERMKDELPFDFRLLVMEVINRLLKKDD